MRSVFLVAATAVITACGGGGSYGSMNGPAYGGGSGSPSGGGAGSPDGGGGTASSAGADAGTTSAGYVITISNLSFSPLDLAVPPGATVAVVNKDGMPHSVTSAARSGAYTRGALAGLAPFDTGEFSSGQRTITIPANAPAGT
jgi:plastocyanin